LDRRACGLKPREGDESRCDLGTDRGRRRLRPRPLGREELLLGEATLRKIGLLRRVLNRMKPVEAMELLVRKLKETRSNTEFLARFDAVGAAAVEDD
jgi:hypothetical protein